MIQNAVNNRPEVLDALITQAAGDVGAIKWLSPLASDDFAEYRDGDFLKLVGVDHLEDQLAAFWPQRGPQWDALARTDRGVVLLVEAKAHISEMCSPPTQAGPASRMMIERALAATAAHMAAKPIVPWGDTFYQLANRFAHLHFLRARGIDARLLLVNFIGDREMRGPSTAAEWEAAYKVAMHVTGVPARNPLGKFIHHIYPSISKLNWTSREY